MFEAFTQMWKDMLEMADKSDENLARVREKLTKVLTEKDSLSDRDLLIISLETHRALVVTQQVQLQHMSMMMRQMTGEMEEVEQKIKDQLRNIGKELGLEPDDDD